MTTVPIAIAFLPLASAASPAQVAPPVKLAAARAQRLVEQKAALEAELAAIEKFGHLDEFLARVAPIAERRESEKGLSPGLPVSDGALPYYPIEQYARWRTPAPDRALARAVDLELANHPFGAIVDLQRQLSAHGIDFLIVVFPSRLELYPELLMPLADVQGFAGMGVDTIKFLLELNRAGVETLSLGPSFVAARYLSGDDHSDQLFLRTDPHWTPRGAELAAHEVAERIAKFPWFVRGAAREGRGFQLVPATFTYNSTEDLAAAGAQPEVVKANFVMQGSHEVQPLLKESRITVLGDSFVNVHQKRGADFCAQLFRFLGGPIDALCSPAGAAKECRNKLRLRTPDDWRSKKLVIWLIADQNFGVTDDWEPIAVFKE